MRIFKDSYSRYVHVDGLKDSLVFWGREGGREARKGRRMSGKRHDNGKKEGGNMEMASARTNK